MKSYSALGFEPPAVTPTEDFPIVVEIEEPVVIPVEAEILPVGVETVIFADHTGSGTEGNWISLRGGFSVSLPQITMTYNGVTEAEYTRGGKNITITALDRINGSTVTYPYEFHRYYQPTQNIRYRYYGDADLAGLPVSARILDATAAEYRDAASDAFNGDLTAMKNILANPVLENSTHVLDVNGDILQASFPSIPAGDYVLVLVNEIAFPYTLTVYSATFIEVIDYNCTVDAPSVAYDDEVSLTVDTTLTGAPAGSYRYGAVLVKQDAYRVDLELTSNGFVNGTSLTGNDVILMNGTNSGWALAGVGLDNIDQGKILEMLEDAFDGGEFTAAFSGYTSATSQELDLALQDLDLGDYYLMVGVWDSSGKRLVGFAQEEVILRRESEPSSNFPVVVEVDDGVDTERIFFADHTNSGTQGNWIALNGGQEFDMPDITMSYSGVTEAQYTRGGSTVTVKALSSIDGATRTYPYATHVIYNDTHLINYTFYGDSDFAGEQVDVRVLDATPIEYREAVSQAFNGNLNALKNILANPIRESAGVVLNVNGDILNGQFSTIPDGDYIMVIVEEQTSPYDLTVYSATFVEFIDYRCQVSAPKSITEGKEIPVTINLSDAPAGSYRYGAMLIKRKAFTVDLELTSDGTVDGTLLTANGVTVVEGTESWFSLAGVGLENIDVAKIQDMLESGFTGGELTLAFSSYTGRTTDFEFIGDDLSPGLYYLMVGAWSPNGDKLVGFKQHEMAITEKVVIWGGSGPSLPPPVPELSNNNTDEENAEILQTILDDFIIGDAVNALNDVNTSKAAAALALIDPDDAVEILKKLELSEVIALIGEMDDAAAAEMLNKLTTETITNILLGLETGKAASVASEMDPVKVALFLEGCVDDPEKFDAVTDILNAMDKVASAGVLLEVSAETGVTLLSEMADKDILKAAERLEEMFKEKIRNPDRLQRVKDRLSKITQSMSVDRLVRLFQQIMQLPETPESVTGIIDYMDEAKVLEVLQGWFSSGDLDSMVTLFDTFEDSMLAKMWRTTVPEERAMLFTMFPDTLIERLPEFGTLTLDKLESVPAMFYLGQAVTVKATYSYEGDTPGQFLVRFSIEDTEKEREYLSLEPGEVKHLSWSYTPLILDTYSYDVEGAAGTFTVSVPPTPADIVLSSLSLNPIEVELDTPVEVKVDARNDGEMSGSIDVTIKLDSKVVDSTRVTLDGGEETAVTFEVSSSEEGVHTVQVDGLDAQFIVLAPPPGLQPWVIGLVAVFVIAVLGFLYYQQRS